MEHYPRGTIEVSEWCRKCAKYTMHRVDGVKLGPCLVCLKRLETDSEKKKDEPLQGMQLDLFGK